MWGNRLGWGISGAMVAGVLLLVFTLQRASGLTPPTPFVRDPLVLAPLELPVSPGSVVTMDEDCDAAELYRQAIDAYRANPGLYERLHDKLGDDQAVPAVDLIVRATRCGRRMSLFRSNLQQVVNYDSNKQWLIALEAVGKAAVRLGMLKAKDNPAEAQKLYEAAFSLGAKLCDERVVYEELRTGLALLGEAGVLMARLAERQDDASRLDSIRKFNEARKSFITQRVQPIQRVVSSISPNVVAQHAGDVFVLARESAEPMWRVEATLKLGRQRFFATRSADQHGANRALRELAKDPDPAVRAAAAAAMELTERQYRMFGT